MGALVFADFALLSAILLPICSNNSVSSAVTNSSENYENSY